MPDTPSKTYGIGLVGVGWFGEMCLIAYGELEQARVAAVADVNLERAREFAPPGAAVYARYEDLLADPAVDIVAINTPPYLHAPMIQQAAAAGKHIFVEKPLATSLDDGKAAVLAAQKAGVKLGIDYVLRHHPLHRLLQQIVQGQVFGRFEHWSLENFAADDKLLRDHWFWDVSQSGGIHIEHGVHFFDLCNTLAQSLPERVAGGQIRRADGRIDRVHAVVRYQNGVLATFYHSFNQIGRYEQTTIRVNCAHGHLISEGWIPVRLAVRGLVDEAGLHLLRLHFGGNLKIVDSFAGGQVFEHGGTSERFVAFVEALLEIPDRWLEYKRAIQAGMRDLIQAIDTGSTPTVRPEDGLLSLAVADLATQAVDTSLAFDRAALAVG